MARRRRSSPAEDLIDLIALLPWWSGVALAAAGYLALHFLASQPSVPSAQSGQVGAIITKSLWKSLVGAGQYVVPIICLVGATLSAWRRHQRSELVSDVIHNPATDALDRISWREFEMLIGEAFRLQGYHVVETGGGGADGGVDLILSKPGQNGREKFLVQCKQWRAFKVGVDVVRELYGEMAARGAAGGFVVTSGRFTDQASQFAEGRNLTLIDGAKLHEIIRSVRGNAGRSQPASVKSAQAAIQQEASQPPCCPQCSKSMVRRRAKRGASAGEAFWGCTNYPACRSTRPIV